MTLFWISVATLMALTLAFIVPPFFRKHETRHVSEDELNLAVIKQQLEELKADLDAGVLDQDQYEAARHDLEKELLADLSAGKSDPTPMTGDPKAGRWAIALLVVAIPAISLPLYFKYGSPSLIPRLAMGDTGRSSEAAGHSAGGQQAGGMLEMIDKLAKKLEQDPNNPDGWKMLARSYMSINRMQDALNAYEAAYQLVPEDAELIMAYGATLAQANNNQFAGRPTELLTKALELAPQDPNAQWMRGIAYFQQADYANAVALWEKVLTHLPAGSPEAQNVTEYLNEARAQLPAGSQSAPGSEGQAAVAAQPSTPPRQAATGAGRILVEVSLDPALRDQVQGSDMVFIFARALSGPRMPLAAMKRQVKDLPVTLELDDSMAMTPQLVLSNFSEVLVGARISKSGDPTPKSGDLEGEISPVVPGQGQTVQVVVNTVHQ